MQQREARVCTLTDRELRGRDAFLICERGCGADESEVVFALGFSSRISLPHCIHSIVLFYRCHGSSRSLRSVCVFGMMTESGSRLGVFGV
jgi:hypothetical protein